MKKIYFILIVFLTVSSNYGQNFNWTSDFNDTDQLNTCNATLALNNNDGNLSNQEKTLTICPDDPNEVITLEFISFSLNTTFSTLEIYNGDSTNSPLVFEYVSDAMPPNPTYIASNPSGCITIKFTTVFIPSIINIGFGAQFVCGDPCQQIFPEVDIDGNTTCEVSDDVPFYRANELLTFTGSALTSNNSPTSELNFEWEIDGDDYSGETVQLSFADVDEIDASLTVTDLQGCQESIDFEFEIRNDVLNINEVDDEYTLDELVSDVFISGDCAIVDNINSPNNLNIYDSNSQSIGYFSKNCSDFPFENGIVIGSGNIEGVTTQAGNSGQGWPGEDELATIATGDPNVGTSNNATVIEFEFSSYEDEISFNYIFASNEYGGTNSFVCNFADTFAFILSGPGINDSNLYNNDANPNTPAINLDLGGLNIATIDNGSGNGLIPTTPTNIHPNPNCPTGSLGEFAVSSLYNQNNPPYHILGGETQVLTATANVIPCEVYTMKIMVADYGDSAFDSYVFLEGGSFNLGANLGDDIFFTDTEPLFEGDVFSAEAFEGSLGGACNFTIEWYKDGELIDGETELTLDITETGNYEIFIISEEDSTLANCNSSDSIYVEFIPVPDPDNIEDIQDLLICQPPVNEFDINLRTNDAFVLGSQNPANFNVDYFLSEADANAGTNAIANPENFSLNASELQNENITIWIRVEEALTGNAQSFVTSSFEIGISEPNLDFAIPDLNGCAINNSNVGVFDLTQAETTIYQENSATGFNVSYFTTETDALNNTNEIENPNAYESSGATETIWVRLSSTFDESCFDVTSLETEIYLQPEINQLTDLSTCGDFSGSQSFDLTIITPTSVNTPDPSITLLSFYNNEADAIAGQNPITNNLATYQLPNGIDSQDIFVRLANNDANGNCFTVESFNLSINNVEIANEINDIFFCSSIASPIYILTAQNNSILGANQVIENYTINYFTSQSDADNNVNAISNPSGYPLPSGVSSQDIFVRISNNDDVNCYETTSFEIGRYIIPQISSIQDLSVCGDFSNTQTFDLTTNNENTVNTPDPNIVEASYHTSFVDAINDSNAISSDLTSYQMPIGLDEQTIYLRLENNQENGNCSAVSSFNLKINNVEVANELDDLLFCPDDTLAIPVYDLTAQNEFILGENQNETDYVITYFTNQNDADNNTNSIPDPSSYMLNAGELTEDVVVRISNVNDVNCYETASFQVGEFVSPELNNLENLSQCGDFSYTQIFDLTINNVNTVNTPDPNIIEASYYTNQVDAEDGINSIDSNLTAYQLPDGIDDQTIFIRLENNEENGGCFQVGQFTISLNNVEIAEDLDNLVQCEEEEVAQFPIFDLTQQIPSILGINSSADYTISFHLSETDADDNISQIANPTGFQPNVTNQEIWVRIENNNDASCFATSSFQVVSQELADVNLTIDDISVCDNTNNSGFYDNFDFNVLIPEINNLNLSDVNISFHESLSDAQNATNAITSPYTNSQAFSQSIYVRVENGTELDTCERFTSFDIFVNTLPDITLPDEPLLDCDEDATGTATFDLTSFEAILFENANPADFTIAYYETQEDADNQVNQIANPVEYFANSPLTSIYIALDNGECPITVNATLSIDPNNESCEGIGVDDFSQQIQLYPNPVRSILHIDYSAVTPIESLKVFNMNGQLVSKQNYNRSQNHIQLDFSEYAAGIYFVEISNGNQIDIQKVIKK
ncbi:choice-of-anchor L domain-containing protein [Psychroflexus planctonicus]|uniref:Secretion system C-terminal sorting domain-containing protein n=1 Tax=Psychroflexus planctonicus TaxID=1526575 RepID=A0ABQ1SIY4_9FLAO|nr:choice-of-anchor L domain-containing protein [Psychroflexus planctonicus]GGE42349.1 hypothetical protein GCM10010832_22880 [Psychroflexus planctonicus]